MLNIPPSLTDSCYAYKMPTPRVKHIFGSQTHLKNICEISKALRVPFEYVMKFMGFEFGCNVNLKRQRLSGRLEEKDLIRVLDKFIREYVLCPKCCLPEVKLKLDKKSHGFIQACNACGANSKRHHGSKTDAYILKDLISEQNGTRHKLPNSDAFQQENDEEDSQEEKDSEEEEEEEEEEKIVEEPQKTFSDLEQDLLTKVKEHYFEYKASKQDDATYAELLDNVYRDVPYQHWNKIPYLLFNGIFDINIIKEINQNEALLKKIYNDFEHCDPQFDLLLNLEKFVYVRINNGDFEKYIPTMLKVFYDVDLLEEDLIRDWDQGKLNTKFIMDFRYQKVDDEKFKKAAKPFIEWLKNAEEEQ